MVTTLPARRCAWCGTEFTPRPGGGKARYCSDAHRYAARDRVRFTPAGTVVERDCASCGRAFSFVQVTGPRRYCDDCRGGARGR